MRDYRNRISLKGGVEGVKVFLGGLEIPRAANFGKRKCDPSSLVASSP